MHHRGEGNLQQWKDFKTEQILYDDDSHILCRVVKKGCCWMAYLGTSSFTGGRFRSLEAAKRAVEQLLSMETLSNAG
jgi:hypothetical protein